MWSSARSFSIASSPTRAESTSVVPPARSAISISSAERAADEIEMALRAGGTTEVDSARVGELAMAKLRALDHIAYIRFASVYQSFEDLATLKREVDSLFAQREIDPELAR